MKVRRNINWPLRWFNLTIIVLSVLVIYQFYKEEILKWSCYEEPNSASCHLLGDYYFSNGEKSNALEAWRFGCENEYERACQSYNLYKSKKPEL